MTKIQFPKRENLIEFLNHLLNLGCPYDFEVGGKEITFHGEDLSSDGMLVSMARALGGVTSEGPSTVTITKKDITERTWPSQAPMRWTTVVPQGRSSL